MKKVLIVGPKKSQHIQKWYQNISDVELHLFTLHPEGRSFSSKVNEHSFSITGGLGFLLSIPYFVYLWWKIRPDVTNFHYLSSYGLLSLFIPNRNLILNTWGTDVNGYNSSNRLKKFFINKSLKKFTWINAPAVHMKKKLIKMGAQKSKIDVFQYGVPKINSTKTSRCNNKNQVLFVSNRNWDSLYQIDTLIDEFIMFLSKTHYEAKLFIYGRGGNIEKKVNQLLIDNPKLREHIELKGYVAHSEMLKEMTSSDVFVSVPKIDGMPLSLLEAMQLGLLPLLSDIDANDEWNIDNNCLVCDVSKKGTLCDYFEECCKIIKDEESTLKIREDWKIFNENLASEKGDFTTNTNRFHEVIYELFNS